MKPGDKVRFHGGWDGKKDRCPICNFPCAYIDPGLIIERYHVWDVESQTPILHPDELWTARLETGSYVVGYPEQFEI
jgi:hypothetical protein